MQKTISLAVVLLFALIPYTSISQNITGILIKVNLKIEFDKGHSCMTQTRAETKEDALYNFSNCGAVKYKLSNRGSFFKIYEKNKWNEWGQYKIAHSFHD